MLGIPRAAKQRTATNKTPRSRRNAGRELGKKAKQARKNAKEFGPRK